ncbi:MAG: diguanylate cyclase [Erysipelotrichaceae bacterium]|nr:diguanylate cyclase [Erysipelotrichaceae bacterium]
MATLIVVMVSMLPATRSVIMSNAIFPISYTVMEAILISMTAVALIMVRKDISFRYAAVGWSIIIGLALSRTLLYLIDWADFSYVAAACSVLLMHLFIQTEEAKKTQARNSYLMSLSMNDKLSGLYNRTAYEEHIATLTAANMTPDFRHMMIDLNNLKFTNDTMGHEAGDELIQAMGSVLSEVVSTYGHAYRIGGDEFACIINASKAEFDIVLVLLKSKAASYSGQYIKGFSFSLGYADPSDFEGKDFTFEDIRKLSDQRMYEDKQRFYIENAQFDRRRSRSVLL